MRQLHRRHQRSRTPILFPCANLNAVYGEWGTAGGVRGAAIDVGLATTSATTPDRLWIATTDADTVVPPDWLLRHVTFAAAGFDAVAGVVELAGEADFTITVAKGVQRLSRFDSPDTHSHVHGANLGVRANHYLEAGWFPRWRARKIMRCGTQ